MYVDTENNSTLINCAWFKDFLGKAFFDFFERPNPNAAYAKCKVVVEREAALKIRARH
jgi:hypothetical protein